METDAMAILDLYEKSYKWLAKVEKEYWDFVDYHENFIMCRVDENEIEDLLDRAKDAFEIAQDKVAEVAKRNRRNKAFMKKYKEIQRYIAVNEGFI